MKTMHLACITLTATLLAAACGGSSSADTDEDTNVHAPGSAGNTQDGGGLDSSLGGGGMGNAGSGGGGGTDGTGGDGTGGADADGGGLGDANADGAAGGDIGDGGDVGDAANACTECLSDKCQDQDAKCRADKDCACYADCLAGGLVDLTACNVKCGGLPPLDALGLAQCTMTSCGVPCASGSTPGGGNPFGDGGSFFGDGGSLFGDGGSIFGDGGLGDLGALGSTCNACLAKDCSAEHTACEASEKCKCWEGCAKASPVCLFQCGLPDDAWNKQLTCAAQKCIGKCP